MSLLIDFPFDHVELKVGDRKHLFKILSYALDLYGENSCLTYLCIETLFTLHFVAEYYDTIIHLPSIFNGLGFLFKSFWFFIFEFFLTLYQWLIDIFS